MAGDGILVVWPQDVNGAGPGSGALRRVGQKYGDHHGPPDGGKGLISYDQQGRTKVFRAAVSRDAVAAAETDSLLQRAYHGSVGLLVDTLAQREALTQADIDELYAILRKAEEGAK